MKRARFFGVLFLVWCLSTLCVAAQGRTAPAPATQGLPVFSTSEVITHQFHPFPDLGVVATKIFFSPGGKFLYQTFQGTTRSFEWPIGSGQTVVCRVIRQDERHGVELVEREWRYYAQADDGSIYQFGEVTHEYYDGVVVGYGDSWLVGGPGLGDPEDTALARVPILVLPATLSLGLTWTSENIAPVSGSYEESTVVGVGESIAVPAGRFSNAVHIMELGDDEEAEIESNYRVPKVGTVMFEDKEVHMTLLTVWWH